MIVSSPHRARGSETLRHIYQGTWAYSLHFDIYTVMPVLTITVWGILRRIIGSSILKYQSVVAVASFGQNVLISDSYGSVSCHIGPFFQEVHR